MDSLPTFNDTFFLRLNDKKHRAAFQAFSEPTLSQSSMFVVFLVYCYAGANFVILSYYHNAEDYKIHTLIGIFLLWLSLFFSIIFLNKKKITLSLVNDQQEALNAIKWQQTAIENILMVLTSIAMGMSLTYRVLHGPCIDQKYINIFHCNPDSDSIPADFMIIMMLYPIIFQTVYKSIKFQTVILSWLINVAFILVNIILVLDSSYAASMSLCVMVALYIPLSLIIICDLQRTNLSYYFLHCRQLWLHEENIRLSQQSEIEMRHMIANVAHDLKTPLSSFQSGVEMITSHVADLTAEYADRKSCCSQSARESVAGIQSFLTDIQNVNAFMLMTINRSLDYAKASNGVQLVPRQESIHVKEVLALPIKCIRDMQSTVSVVFREMQQNICSHIITDKQWLQENILCLLSNAVKYSTKGEVTITVSLVDCASIAPNNALTAARMSIIREQQSKRVPNPSDRADSAPQQTSVLVESTSLSDLQDLDRTVAEIKRLHNKASLAPPMANNAMSGGDITGDVEDQMTSTVRYNSQQKVKEKGETVATSAFQVIFGRGQQNRGSRKVAVGDGLPLHCTQQSDSVKHTSRMVLLFEIEDHGIGVSKDVLGSLFNPFKQAQRLAGGTGLGLFSLARRMEALGGYYGGENRKDGTEGSLFWFAIPYRPDTTSQDLSNSQSSAPSRLASRRPSSSQVHGVPRVGSVELLSIEDNSAEFSSTVHFNTDHCVVYSGTTTKNSFSELPSLKSGDQAHSNLHAPGNQSGINTQGTVVANNKALSMLVVDDSLSILKVTTMMLRKQGHTVTQAKNGAEALDLLSRSMAAGGTTFDVVLMDLQMPIMDGLEATRRLRELEKQVNNSRGHDRKSASAAAVHQFVIGFSANSDDVTMRAALGIGFDDFIGKPFTLDTFNATCSRYFLARNAQSNEWV